MIKIEAFLVPTLAGQVYNRFGEFMSLPALTLAPPVSITKVADGSVTGILSVGAFFEPKSETNDFYSVKTCLSRASERK